MKPFLCALVFLFPPEKLPCFPISLLLSFLPRTLTHRRLCLRVQHPLPVQHCLKQREPERELLPGLQVENLARPCLQSVTLCVNDQSPRPLPACWQQPALTGFH